jgi:hypothetical protein
MRLRQAAPPLRFTHPKQIWLSTCIAPSASAARTVAVPSLGNMDEMITPEMMGLSWTDPCLTRRAADLHPYIRSIRHTIDLAPPISRNGSRSASGAKRRPAVCYLLCLAIHCPILHKVAASSYIAKRTTKKKKRWEKFEVWLHEKISNHEVTWNLGCCTEAVCSYRAALNWG